MNATVAYRQEADVHPIRLAAVSVRPDKQNGPLSKKGPVAVTLGLVSAIEGYLGRPNWSIEQTPLLSVLVPASPDFPLR